MIGCERNQLNLSVGSSHKQGRVRFINLRTVRANSSAVSEQHLNTKLQRISGLHHLQPIIFSKESESQEKSLHIRDEPKNQHWMSVSFWSLRLHYPEIRHHSVMGITTRAWELFAKLLSVDTVCHCIHKWLGLVTPPYKEKDKLEQHPVTSPPSLTTLTWDAQSWKVCDSFTFTQECV